MAAVPPRREHGPPTGAANSERYVSSSDTAPAADVRFPAADLVQSVLVALVAFGVYVATLYPGLSGVGDAAKFSFVGKVLGTPHPPGYPLFVIVSHLFSYLPWGTLAYRMNLLSAVFAAVTVALVYLVVRRLGVGRTAAVSTALALAFGNAFWSRALYAKGYTLNAALVAAGILVLLRWSRTRRAGDLYWASAIFALSIGNHLTVIALLPALVLFPVSTDPRAVLRPKTLAVVMTIVLLGFTQYGLIIVRTLQGAPYLEAHATNLEQLWSVITARRWAHEIGAYPLSMLMSTRVPIVIRLLGAELGPVGIPLICVGFAALLWHRPRHAMLFGLGAAGVAALTANMSSAEDQGFLLSVFVLLWSVVGVGLERTMVALQRNPRWLAAGLAFGVALLLPSSQVVQNYRLNDRHAETFEAEYFDALFAALPPKAAIVDDEYRLDMMVLYKLLGERAAGQRDIRHIRGDRHSVKRFRDDGFEVFAFQQARDNLADYGFRFVPFEIPAAGAAGGVGRQRPIYRLVSTVVCADIGNRGWVDISEVLRPKGRMSVRIDNYRPFDSLVTVYAGADSPFEPALVGATGWGTPSLDVEIFPRDDAAAAGRLAARTAADRPTLPDEVLGARFVVRAQVRVNDHGRHSAFGLDFGEAARAAWALALVDLDNPRRATVCSHAFGGVDAWPAGEPRVMLFPDSSVLEFLDGWYPLERRPDGSKFRWTADRAVLVLPLDHPRPAMVSITADSLNYPGRRDGAMTLVINGQRLGSRPLTGAHTTFSWDVPGDHWRDGLNEVVLEIDGARRPSEVGLSSDDRLLGVSVTQIELAAAGTTRQRGSSNSSTSPTFMVHQRGTETGLKQILSSQAW